MNPIVTKTDIQQYRYIADVLDDTTTLMPHILEAQNVELRSLLGDALFYQLMEGYFTTPVDSKWTELVSGKSYVYNTRTIYYDGLKPLICYWAFARLLSSHGSAVTRFGVVRKINDLSEPISDEALSRMITQARSTSKFYQTQVVQFLDYNRTIYTTWRASESAPRSGGIKISRVSGYDAVKEESTFVGVGSAQVGDVNVVRYVSADYSLISTDSTVVVSTGAADVTVSVPPSSTSGFLYKIFRIIKSDSGAGKVIIKPTGELINGLTQLEIRHQHEVIGIQFGVGEILTITSY